MTRGLLPIFLVVLVDLLGMMMMIPLLPFYAEKFGATPFEIGLLGASFAFFQFLGGPILGHFSDRYGRRPLLLVSQLGTLLGFILMALASHLTLLFLARILDGITAGNISLAQAYVADNTPPEKRAQAFGVLGIALGIGLFIGPAASGFLASKNLLYPIYLAIGLSATSILTTLFLVKKEKRQNITPSKFSFFPAVDSPGIRPGLIQFFFFVFAFGIFSNGLALFLEQNFTNSQGVSFGPREVGYLFSYCGVLGIIVQGGLIGKLVQRFGEEKLIHFGFLADLIGYSLLAIPGSLWGLVAGSTFFSIGNSLLRPSLTSLLTRKAPASQQGVVLGLTSSLQSIGHTLGSPLGGLAIQSGKPGLWPVILSSICLMPLFYKHRQTTHPPQTEHCKNT